MRSELLHHCTHTKVGSRKIIMAINFVKNSGNKPFSSVASADTIQSIFYVCMLNKVSSLNFSMSCVNSKCAGSMLAILQQCPRMTTK